MECNRINSLNFSSFDTRLVTDMSEMFRACDDLDFLNLSTFNTEKVTNMYGMFAF